jgi:hypothetical protein
MKTRALSIIIASVLLLGAGVAHSQAPGQPLTAGQLLGLIRQDNAALLDKQAKTMQALDTLKQQAEEIKIFAKRG